MQEQALWIALNKVKYLLDFIYYGCNALKFTSDFSPRGINNFNLMPKSMFWAFLLNGFFKLY